MERRWKEGGRKGTSFTLFHPSFNFSLKIKAQRSKSDLRPDPSPSSDKTTKTSFRGSKPPVYVWAPTHWSSHFMTPLSVQSVSLLHSLASAFWIPIALGSRAKHYKIQNISSNTTFTGADWDYWLHRDTHILDDTTQTHSFTHAIHWFPSHSNTSKYTHSLNPPPLAQPPSSFLFSAGSIN